MEVFGVKVVVDEGESRAFSVVVDGEVRVRQMMKTVALLAGITGELYEKLKIEVLKDMDVKESVNQRHKGKKGKTEVIVVKKKIGGVGSLEDLSLKEVGVEGKEEILLVNWSKVSSGRKWDTAEAFSRCFRRRPFEVAQLTRFLHDYDYMNASDSCRTFHPGEASSRELQGLLQLLGADANNVFPQEKKGRRIQLVEELFAEYSDPMSIAHSVTYEQSKVDSFMVEEMKIEESVNVSRSAPARSRNIPRRLPVHDIEEKIVMHSAPSIRDSENLLWNLDVDFDIEDDERGNRRRERRRRRRQRSARLSGVNGDWVDHELQYEDLVDLPNVPIGVPQSILESLPLQMMTQRNLEILQKQDAGTCRICLVDYCVGDCVMRLPCLHIYHKQCITKWFNANNKCPQDMLNIELNDL